MISTATTSTTITASARTTGPVATGRRAPSTAARAASALLPALVLVGCTAGTPAESVALEDAWVRASDGDTTAAFGTLEASSDATLVGASSPAAASVELHEVASGTMRPVGEIALPAGEAVALEPGGYHLMLLGLIDALEPGEEVPIVLELGDGTTLERTVVVREAAAGDEEYTPAEHGEHRGGEHGDVHDGGDR